MAIVPPQVKIRGLTVRVNRYVSIAIFVSFFYLAFANPQLSVKLQLDYDSNVFNLSHVESDRFTEGRGFDYIDTKDDFIQRLKLRLSDSYDIGQLTLSPYLDGTYANYLNNSDKSNINLLVGATTRFDNLSINSTFGYNPKIYIRDYSSGVYQYEKMMARFSGNYRFHKLAIPLFYYKYEQYTSTNEFFKEYDAPAHAFGIGWRFLTRYVNADIMYYYHTYTPQSDDDDIAYIIENEKDGSDKSNVYEIKLRTKRFYQTAFDYRIYGSFRYENKYFQSTIPTDSNHFSRIDQITTIGAGADLYLAKNWDINLNYKYKTRSVDSEYTSVIRAKEYDRHSISTTLHYHFNLF